MSLRRGSPVCKVSRRFQRQHGVVGSHPRYGEGLVDEVVAVKTGMAKHIYERCNAKRRGVRFSHASNIVPSRRSERQQHGCHPARLQDRA